MHTHTYTHIHAQTNTHRYTNTTIGSKKNRNTSVPDDLINQSGFFRDLLNRAQRKLPQEFEECTNYIWDITVFFTNLLSSDHVDDFNSDGPGHVIVTLNLTGRGFFIFNVSSNHIHV